MPWFVQLAATVVVLFSTVLVVDYFRRRGLPRLSLPTFRGSGIPDKLSLRLAKTVIDGEFDGSPLSHRPFVRGCALLLVLVVPIYVALCVGLPALLLILLRIMPIFRY